MKGRLVNGCVIEAHPVHYPNAWSTSTRNDIPHVTVRTAGDSGDSGGAAWTPAEARAFAVALLAAADEAEVKP